jgi:hypothetical protein
MKITAYPESVKRRPEAAQAEPRITLQTAAVLREMLESPLADYYGLDLAARTGFPTGTIYPIMTRLERAGWLSSYWENVTPATEGRPRRRLYRLTGRGAHAARDALQDAGRLIGLKSPAPAARSALNEG